MLTTDQQTNPQGANFPSYLVHRDLRDLRYTSPEEILRWESKLKNANTKIASLKIKLETMATDVTLAYEDFIEAHLQYVAATKEREEAKARLEAIYKAKRELHKQEVERKRNLRRLECANLSKLQIISRMSMDGRTLDSEEHKRWMRCTREELIYSYVAEIE